MITYGGVQFDDPFMCFLVQEVRAPWIRSRMEFIRQMPASERPAAMAQIHEIIAADIQTWSFCRENGFDFGQLLGGALMAAIDQVLDGPWMTAKQASAVLHCSPRHARRLAQAKRIEARLSPTGVWRYPPHAVHSYNPRRRRTP